MLARRGGGEAGDTGSVAFRMMPWVHQQLSYERELLWKTTGVPTSRLGRRGRDRCM
ncbi:hypothetical protein BGY98DRAFT_1035653, partial [Russula aff. rugulosa BPL654]